MHTPDDILGWVVFNLTIVCLMNIGINHQMPRPHRKCPDFVYLVGVFCGLEHECFPVYRKAENIRQQCALARR